MTTSGVKPRWFATRCDVPAQAQGVCRLAKVDYSDAFTAAATPGNPAGWARAIFEEAPAPIRELTYAIWATAGYDLGDKGSLAHVLGWRIVERSGAAILLDAESAGLHSQIVVLSQPSAVTVATFMSIKQARWRILFTVAKYVHQLDVSYLVARAARVS